MGVTTAVDGRRTDRALFVFYAVVALVALAGQSGAAVQWLRWWLPVTVVAVAAVEFGGIVLSVYADHRRRLGEHAFTARVLSAAVAVGAVAVNWLGHVGHLKGGGFFVNHLQGGFFAGMSGLGYGVWLLHSGARRRDQLRADGDLPPVAPVYGWWAWLRQPGLTRRARALALADGELGLYGSLAAARTAARTERRQAAISDLLRRKLAEGRDPLAAEIAVTVYDLDVIAERLARRADYDGLTDLIAADLTPDRVAASTSAGPVTGPAVVPLSAHIPAVALSAVRRAVTDTTPDMQADSNPDTDRAADADATTDSRADTEADTRPDVSPDSGADTKTTGRRTTGRTAGRTQPRTSGRTAGRTPKADIATAAQQLRDRHPEWAVADIARRLKVTDRTVRRHLNGSEPTTT